MSLLAGIDPGLSGVVPVRNPAGELKLLAGLPDIRDGRVIWIDGGGLQSLLISARYGRPARECRTRVGGATTGSAFKFDVGSDSVHVQARHVSRTLSDSGARTNAADTTASC